MKLAYICLNSVGGRCLSMELTMLVLHLLNMLVEMSPAHKIRLVHLVTGIFALALRCVQDNFARPVDMPTFPRTKKDLTTMIMGGDGLNLWNRLPIEEVTVFDGNHVTLSIDSLIDHLMAHGVPLSYMQDEKGKRNRNGINGSAAADALLEKLRDIVEAEGGNPDKTAFGYLVLWTDGFTTSWVKQKENSCWCMTVTVAPPNDNDRSAFHTHCIALGSRVVITTSSS